jgi:uncharacterized metal-binding protein
MATEQQTVKVGVISCSGEEIAEGTISRLAARRVLELLRPGQTVTICLPLFLAGGQEERDFARQHPTIAVDGCEKRCAKRGTEMHSGPVSVSLVVSDILDGQCPGCSRSARNLSEVDKEAVWRVSERIAAEIDALLAQNSQAECGEESDAACACTRPVLGGKLEIGGRTVTVAGLPLIFEHLAESGLAADDSSADRLLETVRIYHPIELDEEQAYKRSLIEAYKLYRGKRGDTVNKNVLRETTQRGAP